MMLADRLKKSLEEVMQLSVLEIDLWIGYLRLEQQAASRQMGKLKNKKR
jgi:hypothetical protein|tara:strand:+ start:152 stop:298 length:147 start_codon:yes stop_codon:yes gene_type:complete